MKEDETEDMRMSSRRGLNRKQRNSKDHHRRRHGYDDNQGHDWSQKHDQAGTDRGPVPSGMTSEK